jgi:hypothetical protein
MSRRTLDTEIITIRQVNALTPTNSFIPALTTLTSDGEGGTFWAVPSSLGGIPALNQVVVDNLPFPMTSTFNTFYISTAQGMGSITNSTTKLVTLYSKGFDTFDISGGNTLKSYQNSIVSPTLKLVGRNGVRVSGDPLTRTIFFDSIASAVSTGTYSYSGINVVSNASTVNQEAVLNSNRLLLSAGSVSSILNLVGVGDLVLNGNSTSNSVFLTISSFSSAEYLSISSLVRNTYASTLSTASTFFCDTSTLIQTASSLSNYCISSFLSTSSSLQAQITFTDNNVMNFYTNLDLFKLLSTSLRNSINSNTDVFNTFSNGLASFTSYSSSINTGAFMGTYAGTVGIDQHITISTAQFRLDTLSTFIDNGAQVVITYSPSLLYNFLVTAQGLASVSTFIVAGNSIINEATFVRPWYVTTTNPSGYAPYLYTDSMEFVIRSSNIMNALTSTFTFYHHVDITDVSYGNLASSNVNVLTCANNSLGVTLTGMNY